MTPAQKAYQDYIARQWEIEAQRLQDKAAQQHYNAAHPPVSETDRRQQQCADLKAVCDHGYQMACDDWKNCVYHGMGMSSVNAVDVMQEMDASIQNMEAKYPALMRAMDQTMLPALQRDWAQVEALSQPMDGNQKAIQDYLNQ